VRCHFSLPFRSFPGSAAILAACASGKGDQHGLSIGNLTSRFWGNVYYLNELDQFIKDVGRNATREQESGNRDQMR